MFQNKRKTDSRIRFQNSRFKHKLEQARGYKRAKRIAPMGSGEIFLSKIGLGSWFSRFATLLIFLVLIYIVFIPNIFFVKDISVNGSVGDESSVIKTLTDSYLSKTLPWPQKNLILLSKKGLKNFLVKNDQKILSVNSISKKFPSSLTINVTPRVNQFIIQTASSTDFSVANDGLITNEIFPDSSGTLPGGLALIKIGDSDGIIIGNQALSQNQIKFLNQMQNQLPGVVKSPIIYFEMESLQTPDFTADFKTGPKIMVTFNSDAEQILSRLSLLFSQFSASDIKNLYYVDMRFGDNGYVCKRSAPCAQNTVIPNTAASTSPTNLTN
jgi:hypothetical protein